MEYIITISATIGMVFYVLDIKLSNQINFNNMGNFLKSAYGSYVKTFLAIIIAYMISKGSIFGLDWADLLSSSVISFLPLAIKAINKEGGFFNTIYGGYVKAFLAILVAYVVARGSIINIDWQDMVNTCVMSFLPVLINVLNPKDTRYGTNKEE